MTVTRRLAAILAADVVGYSRLMAADEPGTLARFKLLRSDHVEPALGRHGGRVVGEAGDSLLVEFGTATQAVACAVEIQSKLAALNAELPEDRRMRFRMGVNLGEVIIDGATIHGDGVNIAARLEKLAEPGGIVIAQAIHQQIKGKVPGRFEDLGEQTLHNIAEPVRVYRIAPERVTTPTSKPIRDDRATIAILPFTNMSGDPEQEYFSDGITEDLTTALARSRQLSVVARKSTFLYKDQPVKVQEVGRELGAHYVLEGSVRKGGDRLRVTAQLIDTETGTHLWAEHFDRDLSDIFAVQDEIVRTVMARLIPKLFENDALRRANLLGANLTAFDHHSLGILAWRRGDQLNYIQHLLKAVEIDPLFSVGHAALAGCYANEIFYGTTGKPVEELEHLARIHIERALAAGVNDPLAHADLGIAYGTLGEFEKARSHLERSRSLNPHISATSLTFGKHLAFMGHHGDGLAIIEDVLKRNPDFPDVYRVALPYVYYLARDYEAVVAEVTRFDELRAYQRLILAASLAQLGRQNEAKRAIADLESRRPPGYDVKNVVRAFSRMCRLLEDAEHWLGGFRKAGLIE